ncbi:hypothetical protein [Conexibacter sp. S30A1]|uniref:hypothetical protein n=1 Tax=Conexibacter sp. S30A1 TaxID=2937800 RepID=UPI00200C14C7|nr:hypothetical protein [Conexibacter sp. S30A1]
MRAHGPLAVLWTDHALVKAQLLAVTRLDVEDAILDGHGRRTRNARAADWRVQVGRLVVAYNYPEGDELTALVVTLWRRG